ncbi:trans-sulfuration enzyme family protein [Arenicella xantha]|uniref:Cystathionine beta-lyase/cystathionine gamma-synthase n=1 Tax=Arenicella xantha TaxID=644221 RepID=A0A395JNX8_9GAMM|nr:PLP-dependent transferase [Arenicella xantha]RBP53344.1 cystathionine beta-lyase/cystathionine gamma-synthase [Arenicella xantha]
MSSSQDKLFDSAKKLSPRRNSTEAHSIKELAAEQLSHFNIEVDGELGRTLLEVVERVYECQGNVELMWQASMDGMQNLDASEKTALFNAKKFLSFQLAKVLDTLQNPFRTNYQQLGFSQSTLSAKSAYPVFDNVNAIFSATPVITRTATYIYACAEWISDAFEGKEMMLDIYSRLLNPTSISLANHIVDLEAGPYANEYLAWNFNSGMAAIDATLSHVLGHEDILIASQNIYGGAHQLIHDWFAKPSNLNVAVKQFAGEETQAFVDTLAAVKEQYADRIAAGKQIYLYIESPCNPHGYVLDVPELCKLAHAAGVRVILDATVGTPFLVQPLQREDSNERPDFVIHSYTKDLTGSGSVIAGCVIARNADMFIPKGQDGWDNTMFWNVYYIKGAFLNADTAFEVMAGMRTLEVRMLKKCITTQVFATFMDSHPMIKVNCNGLATNKNRALAEKNLFLGFPAGLFTVDMGKQVPDEAFHRFFDCLEPAFAHMISLGQTNSIVSCPGLTTHSELNAEQQQEAQIFPTTIRFAMGIENPVDLIKHLVIATELSIDQAIPGFSKQFMSIDEARKMAQEIYVDMHQRYSQAVM